MKGGGESATGPNSVRFATNLYANTAYSQLATLDKAFPSHKLLEQQLATNGCVRLKTRALATKGPNKS